MKAHQLKSFLEYYCRFIEGSKLFHNFIKLLFVTKSLIYLILVNFNFCAELICWCMK